MINSKIGILIVVIVIVNLDHARSCILDSTCLPSQFCEGLPIGRCVDGYKEGMACLTDRSCESKKCSFFRCTKRIGIKDGPCKKSADCLNNQYCDDVQGRKDLRQCMDRKASGYCRKDSQCISDNCSWFRCSSSRK